MQTVRSSSAIDRVAKYRTSRSNDHAGTSGVTTKSHFKCYESSPFRSFWQWPHRFIVSKRINIIAAASSSAPAKSLPRRLAADFP